MRRLLCALMVLMLPGAAMGAVGGAGGVYAMKKNDFYSVPFPGTDVGIKQASDYAGTGGEVKIAAGRYLFNSTVIFDKSGQTITGAGDSTVFVNNAVGGDTLIVVFGSYVTLQNFQIDGLAPAVSVGQGIKIEQGTGATIRNVHIVRTPSAAIHVHMNTTKVHILDCRIENIGHASAANRDGIIFHQSTDGEAIGNTITGCMDYGIWVQAASKSINITGNTLAFNGDGVHADEGNLHVNVSGNVIKGNQSDGVSMDADSSSVVGNLITGNRDFGLWSTVQGNGGNWVGNTFTNNGNYAMSVTVGAGRTAAGWAILSNFCLNNALPIELQTDVASSLSNVMIANNYIIGNSLNKPLIRLNPLTASTMDKIHIIGNVLKNSVNEGILIAPVGGTTTVTRLAIIGNEIYDTAGRGISTKLVGTGTARITDNLLSGTGSTSCGSCDEESLSASGWTYGSFGKIYDRKTVGIFSDSLRSAKGVRVGPYTAATLPSMGDGTLVYCVDCTKSTPCAGGGSGAFAHRTNGTWDCLAPAAGGSGDSTGLAYLPGRTSGQVLFGSNATSTGAGTYLGLKGFNGAGSATLKINTDGVFTGPFTVTGKETITDSLRINSRLIVDTGAQITGASFIQGSLNLGSGGAFTKEGTVGNVSMPTAGNAINFSASGANTVRATDGASTLAFSAAGGSNEVTLSSGATQVEQKLTVVDSVRVNKKLTADAGAFVTGASWIAGNIDVGGKATVLDSIRVNGRIVVGKRSGVPSVHTIGAGGATQADSVTVVLNGGGLGGTDYSPKIVFQRDGATEATLAINGTNTVLRIEQGSNFFRIGPLGSTAFGFTVDANGHVEIGGGTPSYGLEVQSDAYILDSLRVAKRIQVDNGLFVTGNSWLSGKYEISDSLRVNQGIMVGGPMIKRILSGTASLDFDMSIATCTDLTMSIPGAAVGDVVLLGAPLEPFDGSVSGELFNKTTAWVSASGTVTVRMCRDGSAHNPDAGTFRATVLQY